MSSAPLLIRKSLKRTRPTARQDVESLVKAIASRKWSRRLLNLLYRQFSFAQMSAFHTQFAKLFRTLHGPVADGVWKVKFAGKEVRLPLVSDRFWLDWDCALSVLGHDTDVKVTYANFLKSPIVPDLFVDIGANYGMHSLLFLTHGIKVLSFDPNPHCHSYFREVCTFNNLEPNITAVALGSEAGVTELCFPETETWLGTTNATLKQELESTGTLLKVSVEQRRLDDYLPMFRSKRLLIKIDTEGSEFSILKSGTRVLDEYRPHVIFESIDSTNRFELYELFETHRYGITKLPWMPGTATSFLDNDCFVNDHATNFIAVPMEPLKSVR